MWTAAADGCRRRGRPRKNHRTPAGRPPRSPPASRLRLRRRQRPLRDDFSDIEGDESERENEHEYDESDGEHERRRVKKKLKLLLKLHLPTSPLRREPSPASSVSFPTDESGSENGECRSRKQKMGRGRRGAGHREVERKQVGCNGKVFASESGTPLPDQKTLESILDKIQMKDKYGVFGDPVDLEELPDYLEIIEHPMDFGTIRKKLARKIFANLEEFEADVYLVCNNAMQYNAPETVYHKQAHSMHEVAKKGFQSVRAESRSCETFCKTELNDFPHSLEKEQPESFNLVPREKAGSEISSIAITINEDDAIGLGAMETTGSEKSIKNSGVAVVEASSTIEKSETPHLEDAKQSFNLKDPHQSGTNQEVTDILMERVEKVEEVSEKGNASNCGPKLDSADESCNPVDENRRATYNISNQPTVYQHDSVFSIFGDEEKQLVAVGLDAEYSYARSLARFSATLGPIGWRIASEKIEKALPAGVKFGPGWVGEYEPLPTPILSVVENILHNDKKNSVVHEAPVKGSSQRNNVDRNRKESTEDQQNVTLKAKHNAVATSVQMGMPCRVTSPLVEGQAPISTVNKSNGEGNVEGKLGAFQFSSRHQLAMVNDLVRSQRDKSAGVPWLDQTIENGKANFPKSESNVNSSLARNGLVDSASKKPRFLFETANTANTRYPPPVGFKSLTESESRKGAWISTNQAPMSVNTGFPTNRDLQNLCSSPISMSAEKKGAANSCNRDGTSSSSVSCSGEAMHNSHANATASQVTKDNLHSMKMMPGNMPKLQNYTSSVTTNSTRQFIPALSPRYPPNSISGTENGSGGITHSDSTATIPMNAWISIGNYSEPKSTEAPDFLKVQAEPHVYGPCISSLASGMYQVTSGRQLLHSSNSHTPNGRPLLPLTSQMVAEKSDLQKSNLASSRLISSELSKPQHMFSWRDPMANGKQRKSEDMLPPDLNIGFQSPGSPVHRSSGIRVDSQPDLALQL